MKPSELYRLEVAPLIILPLGKSPLFSYLSNEPVAPGSLVAISFGKRSLEGVVFGVAPLLGKAPLWMKFISAVIEKEFLTKNQLALAQYIGDEYFTSLGKVLKHFLPKRTKIKKKEKEMRNKQERVKLHKDDTIVLKKFLALKKGSVSYLNKNFLKNFDQFLVQLTKKMTTGQKQVFIIVPEIILLPSLETSLSQYFSNEKIAVLQSKLSDSAYFEAWEKIRSGEASVILATRQGLFAPFQNLSTIIVLEEQDESYKQWNMSPRYNGKIVAQKLTELSGAKLILSSGIPGIDSFYHLQKKEYVPLHPLGSLPSLAKFIQIVNLRLERFKKNYSPLSQELKTALQETLNHKEQALLYIHRQGMNAFSVCENCKNILRCPESNHILSSTMDGTFRCLGCSYKTGSFPSCPHCGHLSFKHVGFGTERVERDIKKLFPGARIFRADGTTLRTEKNIQKFYSDMSSGKIDILIGTQMILKGHALPKLALVGMIDVDSLLSFPDFRADEKLFQIVTRFIEQGKENAVMRIIMQTFHPESTFFQRIATLDSQAFLDKILAEREDLFYPPFSRLISIICCGKTEQEALNKARELGKNVENFFHHSKTHYRIQVSEVAKRQLSKKIFESIVLLRIPSGESLPKDVQIFLNKRDMTYIIDVDPLSFS